MAMSADDLLIFMLDLIAAASGRQWLPPHPGIPQRIR